MTREELVRSLRSRILRIDREAADRIEADGKLIAEMREVIGKARLSLSAAARDFHAQQAEDLLFYGLAKLEDKQ